ARHDGVNREALDAAALARSSAAASRRVGSEAGGGVAGPHDAAASGGVFRRAEKVFAAGSLLCLGWWRRGALGSRDAARRACGALAAAWPAGDDRLGAAQQPGGAAGESRRARGDDHRGWL